MVNRILNEVEKKYKEFKNKKLIRIEEDGNVNKGKTFVLSKL